MVKRRFVDTHVHFWDVATGWYRFPTPGDDFGLGDVSTFPQVFTVEDYYRATAAVDVPKIVHVSATDTAYGAYEETRWLSAMNAARGTPHAIISTVDATRSMAEIERVLDSQMTDAPIYRGIRLLHSIDYETEIGRGLMVALAERKLIYDCVAHPGGGIAAAARAAERNPGLPFIMEHTGWPLSATDKDHWRAWKDEMRAFAGNANTYCKLSGLGMTFHHTDADKFRARWNECIELFGVERCMFGSNFPVDSLYGSFDDLLAAFEATAAAFSPEEQSALFADNAERIYRV
jgi:predicted TIM-barrel fold metal-dependent hydrolase